jgi:flagellar biosynthesis protein FlhA
MHETRDTVRTLWPSEEGRFLPWTAGQQGQQTFLKMARNGEEVLLFAGVGGVMEAEVGRTMMKLVNDGWAVQGEVSVSFDGDAEPEMEALFGPEVCVLELGSALLPLVDPFQNAPLLEKIRDLRREVARDLGLVAPGVSVRDDLSLEPSRYRLRLRGVPVAEGEIFLDRFLAVGSLEQLAGLTGWTTVEPTYRLPARWIEPVEREKAEAAHCTLIGGLAVLLTHVRDAIRAHAPQLLGLQETHHLLLRLRQSHPIVVEEFLSSIRRVRKVRHVLGELLSEGVPIRDLITILEVLGDALDRLEDTEAMTELARSALARDILTRLTDPEGVVRGLVLDDQTERRLREEPQPGPLEVDGLCRAVREALDEHPAATALFAPQDIRRTVRARLRRAFPHLAVVSVADIVPGPRVEIAGSVRWSAAPSAVDEGEAADEAARPGFWKTRKKK